MKLNRLVASDSKSVGIALLAALATSACGFFPCDAKETIPEAAEEPTEYSVDSVEFCGVQAGPTVKPDLPVDPSRKEFFSKHPFSQLESRGGRVLTSPRVVAVFFEGEPGQQDAEWFLKSYGCTRHWREAVSEYGVGDLGFRRSVVLPAAPEGTFATRASLEAWIGKKLTEGAFGPIEQDDVLTILPPKGTEVAPGWELQEWSKDAADEQSLAWVAPTGLHGSVGIIPYATAAPTVGRARYVGLSRWLLAAATNPTPKSSPAWSVLGRGKRSLRWSASNRWGVWKNREALVDVEAACICNSKEPSDYPFDVATMYSSRLARAGQNPCPDGLPVLAGVSNEGRRQLSSDHEWIRGRDVRFAVRVFHEGPDDVLLYGTVTSDCSGAIGYGEGESGPFPAKNGQVVTLDLFRRPGSTGACLVIYTKTVDGRMLDETYFDVGP